jgi:hypothetical protein
MNDFTQLGVADYNQSFLDALEFVDDVIQERQHMKVSVWRSKVPRGPYMLGEGLVKKSYRFHAGLGDQRGMQKWSPIQISRVASGDDPGVDACAYNPYMVDYGFETVNYSGVQTSRRTKHICIRDIRFTWEFNQQLKLIFDFLGDITNSVWENYGRETYIKFCVDGSNGFVLAGGPPNSVNFSYDPYSVDDDGDNTITVSAGTDFSTINWDHLAWFSRWLEMQAPQSAIGNSNGRPVYGLVFDMEDWDKMVRGDAALREDYRYGAPQVLIDQYGSVTNYKGYALMHDVAAPRFKIKSTDGTDIVLKRVDPLVDNEAVTIGNKVNVNPDYLNAEFAMGVIFMNDVYKLEVPPAGPTSPGGGTMFGATPSLNGEFRWLNIQDQENNLLNENGFYFGRYEAFAKPLTYDGDAICFLYARCPWVGPTSCSIGSDPQSDAVSLASSPSAGDADATNKTLTLTLAEFLDCQAGDAVTMKKDATAGAATLTAYIADASLAPTYTFAADTAFTVAEWTHTDGPTVTCGA